MFCKYCASVTEYKMNTLLYPIAVNKQLSSVNSSFLYGYDIKIDIEMMINHTSFTISAFLQLFFI